MRQKVQQRNMKPEGETKQIKNFIYNTEDSVGKGFSSTVYKGTNLTNNTPVAIKVIDLKSIKTDVEKRLLGNQMKALRMLNNENIIQTFDIYQTANNAYIISQLCSTGDLTAYYSRNPPLSQSQIIKILTGIVSGVQHFASKGIIHRDLKPSNILVNNGIAKIIDFGFCEIIAEKQEPKIKYNVGSPLYMSPQAYRNSNYSDKSDIWAIGVIFYQIIIGKTPFKGIDYDTMVKNVTSGQIYKEIQNGFFKMLLSRMLSLDVQRRIDINELYNTLSQQISLNSKTVVRKASGNNFVGENKDTQIKQKHTSLSKLPVHLQQASPRKQKPIILNQNLAFHSEKKIPQTIQTINTDRISVKKKQSSSNLMTYITFLYRVSKITRGQASRSTFIERIHHLSLSQLKSVIQHYKGIQSTEILKISNFIKQSCDNFNIATYSNDLYFSNICSNTSNWLSETSTDYIIFWLKLILSQLYQQFSRPQSLNMFETQKFSIYLYLSEYYKFLYSTRGKQILDIDGVELLSVSKLLSEMKVMSKQNINIINNYVKTMI